MSSNLASSVLLCAVDGHELLPDEKRFYESHPPAGFTLFSRNISPNYKETIKLTRQLQGFDSEPAIIAIDQEGGRVNRIKGQFVDEGSPMALCGGGCEPQVLEEISKYALELGKGLIEIGVNVNFAPVVDVLTNAENTAIGDRAFACNEKDVALRAKAFLSGQNKSGVLGCLKHFPGQGAANVDTHLGSALITMSLEELTSKHLKPFVELMPFAEMVMISHCIYDCLDVKPASLSSTVIQDLLVKKLGFEGLVVSDDFNMKAIGQDDKSWQEAVTAAFVAGSHLALVCQHLDKIKLAEEVLRRESQKSPAFLALLESAAKKIAITRSNLR